MSELMQVGKQQFDLVLQLQDDDDLLREFEAERRRIDAEITLLEIRIARTREALLRAQGAALHIKQRQEEAQAEEAEKTGESGTREET